MNQPLDYLARQRALDPLTSFAVSAPAGSGKTGLLTQRLLKLLSLCDNPEEVLAITFTRKAAGEMQERVIKALWDAKEKPQPSNPHDQLTWELATALLAHDSQKKWNLLQCPQRLRIQTIDSLCSGIARQLPIASGFGSQPKPTDDTEDAYRKAVHSLLNELESDKEIRHDLRRLLEHLDNNLQALETLLIALLAKRDQWLGLVFQAKHKDAKAYLENVLQEINIEQMKKVSQVLRLHASELASIADWAASNLQSSLPESPIASLYGIVGLPEASVNNIPQWLAIAELLLTADGTFRKSLTKSQGFPAAKENKDSGTFKNRFGELIGAIVDLEPNAADVIHELRLLPSTHYEQSQWELLDSLTRLLPQLAAQLDIVFAQLGESDFTAVSQAALTALGFDDSPTDIALQLDYRIRHILIDEFQDTASTQLDLLQKLTAGWQPNDGRTLFIVGDGMQSCYSFRNANVGIFLEARAQGVGQLPLEALDLTVNFRSQSGIVSWVNQQFSIAFPAQDDISRGAVKYSPSYAFKPALDGKSVQLFLSGFEKANDQQESDANEDAIDDVYIAEQKEAEAVAQLIQKIRQEHPEDSVALLARGRNHLQQIFPAMTRLGLSWQATDIDSLAQRMAIIDLTSLTKALLDPTDRIAWLAVLRAPWCGLNLHDLHTLVNAPLSEQNPKCRHSDFPLICQQVFLYEQIDGLSEAAQLSLRRFVKVIKPALAMRQRKSLRQWIEGIWLSLGGPATLLDPEDIKDIPTFFSLLESHQKSGLIQDWNRFTRAVEKLYAAPRQQADTKLQVMTMHKSKGLEFDHVIIPRLHKLSPSDGQQLLLWRERLNHKGERQLLLGPLAPVGGDKDKLYKYIQKEAALQLEYEATRLFYVGCTRAIKHLYLFATLAKTEDGTWKTPPKKSLLNSIWANVGNDAESIASSELPANSPSTSLCEKPGLQHLLRLQPNWEIPAIADNQLLKPYRGKEFGDEDNLPELESRDAKLARHTGTLIHQALQGLVNLPAETNTARWIESQKAFWKLRLKQNVWRAEESNIAVEKISRALQNTLSDEKGRWILDSQHQQSECELAIVLTQQTTTELKLRENIIDRTFISNGIRWIIDYKSSEPANDQSITDFIQQEVNTYRDQLLRYQSCFVALGESNIKLALYFPLLDSQEKLIEIDDKHFTSTTPS